MPKKVMRGGKREVVWVARSPKVRGGGGRGRATLPSPAAAGVGNRTGGLNERQAATKMRRYNAINQIARALRGQPATRPQSSGRKRKKAY